MASHSLLLVYDVDTTPAHDHAHLGPSTTAKNPNRTAPLPNSNQVTGINTFEFHIGLYGQDQSGKTCIREALESCISADSRINPPGRGISQKPSRNMISSGPRTCYHPSAITNTVIRWQEIHRLDLVHEAPSSSTSPGPSVQCALVMIKDTFTLADRATIKGIRQCRPVPEILLLRSYSDQAIQNIMDDQSITQERAKKIFIDSARGNILQGSKGLGVKSKHIFLVNMFDFVSCEQPHGGQGTRIGASGYSIDEGRLLRELNVIVAIAKKHHAKKSRSAVAQVLLTIRSAIQRMFRGTGTADQKSHPGATPALTKRAASRTRFPKSR